MQAGSAPFWRRLTQAGAKIAATEPARVAATERRLCGRPLLPDRRSRPSTADLAAVDEVRWNGRKILCQAGEQGGVPIVPKPESRSNGAASEAMGVGAIGPAAIIFDGR